MQFVTVAFLLMLLMSAAPCKSFWGFRKSYLEAFPGYFSTGDAGVIDEHGYVTVLERNWSRVEDERAVAVGMVGLFRKLLWRSLLPQNLYYFLQRIMAILRC